MAEVAEPHRGNFAWKHDRRVASCGASSLIRSLAYTDLYSCLGVLWGVPGEWNVLPAAWLLERRLNLVADEQSGKAFMNVIIKQYEH